MNAAPPAPRPSLLRWLLPSLAVLFLATAGLWLVYTQVLKPPDVTYAQFQTLLDGGQVSRVVVRGGNAIVNLRGSDRPASVSLRLPEDVTISGSPESARFEAQVTAQTGDYQIEASGKWIGVFLTFLPALLFVGLPCASPLFCCGCRAAAARRTTFWNTKGPPQSHL